MKFQKQLAVLTTLASLAACNSNSGDKQIGILALTDELVSSLNKSINTQFLDSPVRGLNVLSEDGETTTVTGSGGSFSCLTGQLVDFKLGNLSLGKAACSDRIFITEIVKGDFNKAAGLGSILQVLGGDDEVELDVSEYKDKDLASLQDAVDTYVKGDGSVESLGVLLTAFKDEGLPGFDEAAADPEATFNSSKEHIKKTISQYATMPGWAVSGGGNVSFNGTLLLDSENSNAEDCAQSSELSGIIEYDSELGFYKYRYQVIEKHVAEDGTTKSILHSSDGTVTGVTDQKPDYKETDEKNAIALTGDSLTSSYTARYESRSINFLNSLNFEGEDLNALTMKGIVGNMFYNSEAEEEEDNGVLGCLYKANLAGELITSEESTPSPEPEEPTPTPEPTPEPAPEA